MKLSDWIGGGTLFVAGTVMYLSNYKRIDKDGKARARVGLGIMFGGALLSVGWWMFCLVLSGN